VPALQESDVHGLLSSQFGGPAGGSLGVWPTAVAGSQESLAGANSLK
jgi:hypothetical protein